MQRRAIHTSLTPITKQHDSRATHTSHPATHILLEQETYAIRGAIFEVYREMGCGFLEAVYQECLEKEFAKVGIPFVAQYDLRLSYKGQTLKHFYRPDFVCYDSIILEIKALSQIVGEHKAQLLNYLKGSGLKVGLLANFGTYPKATIDRLLL